MNKKSFKKMSIDEFNGCGVQGGRNTSNNRDDNVNKEQKKFEEKCFLASDVANIKKVNHTVYDSVASQVPNDVALDVSTISFADKVKFGTVGVKSQNKKETKINEIFFARAKSFNGAAAKGKILLAAQFEEVAKKKQQEQDAIFYEKMYNMNNDLKYYLLTDVFHHWKQQNGNELDDWEERTQMGTKMIHDLCKFYDVDPKNIMRTFESFRDVVAKPPGNFDYHSVPRSLTSVCGNGSSTKCSTCPFIHSYDIVKYVKNNTGVGLVVVEKNKVSESIRSRIYYYDDPYFTDDSDDDAYVYEHKYVDKYSVVLITRLTKSDKFIKVPLFVGLEKDIKNGFVFAKDVNRGNTSNMLQNKQDVPQIYKSFVGKNPNVYLQDEDDEDDEKRNQFLSMSVEEDLDRVTYNVIRVLGIVENVFEWDKLRKIDDLKEFPKSPEYNNLFKVNNALVGDKKTWQSFITRKVMSIGGMTTDSLIHRREIAELVGNNSFVLDLVLPMGYSFPLINQQEEDEQQLFKNENLPTSVDPVQNDIVNIQQPESTNDIQKTEPTKNVEVQQPQPIENVQQQQEEPTKDIKDVPQPDVIVQNPEPNNESVKTRINEQPIQSTNSVHNGEDAKVSCYPEGYPKGYFEGYPAGNSNNIMSQHNPYAYDVHPVYFNQNGVDGVLIPDNHSMTGFVFIPFYREVFIPNMSSYGITSTQSPGDFSRHWRLNH